MCQVAVFSFGQKEPTSGLVLIACPPFPRMHLRGDVSGSHGLTRNAWTSRHELVTGASVCNQPDTSCPCDKRQDEGWRTRRQRNSLLTGVEYAVSCSQHEMKLSTPGLQHHQSLHFINNQGTTHLRTPLSLPVSYFSPS